MLLVAMVMVQSAVNLLAEDKITRLSTLPHPKARRRLHGVALTFGYPRSTVAFAATFPLLLRRRFTREDAPEKQDVYFIWKNHAARLKMEACLLSHDNSTLNDSTDVPIWIRIGAQKCTVSILPSEPG